jgi:AraC-like DNA-binding protein
MKPASDAKSVPLIALSSIRPFLNVLKMNGHQVHPIVKSVGLPDFEPGAELMVPVQAWYDFAEAVASELSDVYAGYKVGFHQSFAAMSHSAHLEFGGATLGEILNTMVVDFNRVGNYATYKLISDGKWVSIEARRLFRPSSRPVQIDAYSIGHMVQLTMRFAGEGWDASQFRASVIEPKAIPASALPQSSLSRCSTKGASIRFPAHWLLCCEGGVRRQKEVAFAKRRNGFLPSVGHVLKLHLAEPDLTLEKLANYVSVPPSELRRRFAVADTTFSHEIRSARFERAKTLLSDTNLKIGEIRREVGYSNDSSFTRAFKRHVGLTPSQIRDK